VLAPYVEEEQFFDGALFYKNLSGNGAASYRNGVYIVNLPAGHCVQFAAFSPVHPGLHWQSVIPVLPATETELNKHGRHAEGPGIVL